MATVAQRPKIVGVKTPALHLIRTPCSALNGLYMVHLRCDGRTIIQQTILTEGMLGKVRSTETPPAMTIHQT